MELKKQKYLRNHGCIHLNLLTCDKCDIKTTIAKSFVIHDNFWHLGISFNCDEGQCEFKTSTDGALKLHKLGMHERGKFKECDQCDFKAAQNSRLTEHKTMVHEGITFICDKCYYQSGKNCLLKEHIKYKHLQTTIVFNMFINIYQICFFFVKIVSTVFPLVLKRFCLVAKCQPFWPANLQSRARKKGA